MTKDYKLWTLIQMRTETEIMGIVLIYLLDK